MCPERHGTGAWVYVSGLQRRRSRCLAYSLQRLPKGVVALRLKMAKDVGVSRGAMSENNAGIMSAGNSVEAQHYATFGWALIQLTGVTEWEVI